MVTPLQDIHFTQDEVSKFQEMFKSYDRNHDGRVDTSELYQLTKSLGEDATSDELDFVIKSFDMDEDGKLNFKEFLSLMTTLRSVGLE